MSRGVNKVILVGHLGGDPETRYTSAGTAITSVSLATSEQWKDKETNERKERTEWHRITFFGRLAEIAGEYLRKGSLIYVEGQLRTEEYEDKEGIKRWSTKVYASELQMLSSKGSGEGSEEVRRHASRSDAAADRAAASARGRSSGRAGDRPSGENSDPGLSDDDIPF